MTVYPHFEVFRRNGERWGRLLADYTFETPIKGYNVTLNTGEMHCTLRDTGMLTIYSLSQWNFGNGRVTVQDLAMVLASLAHDAFCELTNRGLLPWSVRAQADNYFAASLWSSSAGGLLSALSTGWRWMLVSANSQTLARLKAKPYQFKTED